MCNLVNRITCVKLAIVFRVVDASVWIRSENHILNNKVEFNVEWCKSFCMNVIFSL